MECQMQHMYKVQTDFIIDFVLNILEINFIIDLVFNFEIN